MSKTREQRLRRVLETMTRQHDRLRDPPAYGSWLLGWVSERPLRRRVRIQIILTIALITANLVGIGLAVLLENVAFPTPSIVSDAPLWITFVAGPAYTVIGMALGSYYVKVQTLAALRWASEEHTPSRADQRNTLLAPLRVAVGPSSCGQSERRCLPPSTGWLTAYSSRRSCSRHCFAAFWSPPPATCSPSSLCARWPPRHSRPGYRRDGSHWESSAGPWWCGCSARACRSSVSPC
ncbi:adenylate cyclase [Mycobacterium tuberculosis]|nr:adenylate cyclase [Mycobacterium tuberculosis]SGD80399.1 adenylate cyclase [Mycobacterium tuberculosis]SGG10955.1 adenylate cyclase [Mycobacterium tuberculosis]SGG80752.1 adenylate cyclase [Mycobacterium tuberculosis]SHB44126.1 adenylate cyclase [Mycobacterium tuberculosis]